MSKALQYAFIESNGKPIKIRGNTVVQGDTIFIKKGLVRCRFFGPLDGKQGVCLKAPKGKIYLSDGSTAEALHIWNEPRLPSLIEHLVECPKGELKLWNIYRIMHQDGTITEDKWTGDAGMVIDEVAENRRIYNCSDGIGDFDPTDFRFEIEWLVRD